MTFEEVLDHALAMLQRFDGHIAQYLGDGLLAAPPQVQICLTPVLMVGLL